MRDGADTLRRGEDLFRSSAGKCFTASRLVAPLEMDEFSEEVRCFAEIQSRLAERFFHLRLSLGLRHGVDGDLPPSGNLSCLVCAGFHGLCD